MTLLKKILKEIRSSILNDYDLRFCVNSVMIAVAFTLLVFIYALINKILTQ